MSKHLNVGKIVNTHNLNGTVKVYPAICDITDFEHYNCVYTLGSKAETLEISSVKYKKNMVLLKFSAYHHINDIGHLIGQELYIDKAVADDLLNEGEYLLSDLIGLHIYDEAGKDYGEITNMRSTPLQDTLEIMHKGETWYLPFVDAFILDVNLSKGIKVYLIEGLLDEN